MKGFIDSYTGVAIVVICGAVGVFLIFPGNPREPGPEPEPEPGTTPQPTPAAGS